MAASGGGGKVLGGLVVLGGVIWVGQLVADNWQTILGAIAALLAIVAILLILWGHVAGAPAGDRHDPHRAITRRKLTWIGNGVGYVLALGFVWLAPIPDTESPAARVLTVLASFGVILAAVHGLCWLLGRFLAVIVRPYFAAPVPEADALRTEREDTAKKSHSHRSQPPPDPAELQRQQQARQRAEQERKRLDEEVRRRIEEELRRKQAQEAARASSAMVIRTEQQALDCLGLTKPFTSQELKSRWKQILKKVHPDQGGTDMMARLATESYELLKSRVE